MQKLTFIENSNGTKEVLYGDIQTEQVKKIIIRTVSQKEFNKITEMTIDRVNELIDSVLYYNTLNIDEK